ncbi:hypothetical protein [Blautia acetigignens]|uniref:Transposase, YhgA-like n=1 Tax=Blautia acetigignens TaxID=2981783 RepID=A0ABV1CW94_9FIRM
MMELQADSGVQEEQNILPAANRKYKDTIFRMLFSDKKNLLSLYNALNGKNYSDCAQLEIVTLENAIYMSMKNDLAFILDLALFLWEHQSTYNPNIPLRDLMYIAKEYEKYIKEKGISLYSNRQQKIPAPQFIVFYNGNRKIGERMEHRLSDAYETSNGEPALELKVLVISINEGYNQKLMESCQILKEYAQYVSKVRTYKKKLKLNEAVEKAVEECIQEGILREFLLKHRAEVVAMSIFEYDREWEEEILRKEEFEAGKELGEQLGKEKERKNIEKERKNTEKERRRADSEKMRADSEKIRADNAEKELLLLKGKLALLENR